MTDWENGTEDYLFADVRVITTQPSQTSNRFSYSFLGGEKRWLFPQRVEGSTPAMIYIVGSMKKTLHANFYCLAAGS